MWRVIECRRTPCLSCAQQGGPVIRRAAQHHAVKPSRESGGDGAAIRHAAVEHNGQPRPLALQSVHIAVLERRNFAVFFRGQSAEYGGARVHNERIHPGGGDRVDKAREKFIIVSIVDADAAFDGHRHARRIAHTQHALGDQCRVQHQAGTE